MIESGLRINAIKAYRDRTHVHLRLAKMVVEKKHDEMVNHGHRKQNPV